MHTFETRFQFLQFATLSADPLSVLGKFPRGLCMKSCRSRLNFVWTHRRYVSNGASISPFGVQQLAALSSAPLGTELRVIRCSVPGSLSEDQQIWGISAQSIRTVQPCRGFASCEKSGHG